MANGDKITVRILKNALNKCDDNAEIRMLSDAEGNSIHALDFIDKTSEKGIVYLIPSHDWLED